MSTYPHLLSPLRVAGVDLPNRMVMGAMHTRLETMDRPHERLAAFYAARAAGEIGLILTGGYSPVPEGVMDEGGLVLQKPGDLGEHRAITSAVNEAGGRIVLQILHAGRYAKVSTCVAPSAGKARINVFPPRALTTEEVWATVESFANTSALAEQAGYVGVEIMGSEGYLINEFTAALTNQRDDEFGGDFERRIRFPLEIVKAVRARVSPEFMVIYRISSIDLMDGGMTGEEVAELARRVEAAGADMINTGIGWHESSVPTMAAPVPRAAWIDAIRNVKRAVGIPVMASNRINAPDVAEEIIASGAADLVSMARPLLADPEFARKTRENRADEINTCIACNQACLDHIFKGKLTSCLVNPRACHETELKIVKAGSPKRVAVVGAGPAGMACATTAAECGHDVTLFDAASRIGGQFNIARQIPGKEDFNETLRYFGRRIQTTGVKLELNRRVDAEALKAGGFDHVVLATGITPRKLAIPGIDHPMVSNYLDIIEGRKVAGRSVAIVGAGGIGFDVGEFLTHAHDGRSEAERFDAEWGIDRSYASRGGLKPAVDEDAPRRVYLLQRKSSKVGDGLAKTTGWIRRTLLKKRGVAMIAGVDYKSIDDAGLHITINGEPKTLPVDTVVVCAGQEPRRDLFAPLQAAGVPVTLIGGADVAAELDAKRAIDQGTRVAVAL